MSDGPYALSILHHDKAPDGQDIVTTVNVEHATVDEVGHLASHLSRDNPWFVVIQDRSGAFQGAFLDGTYIESTTPQADMIALAELWQAETMEQNA